MLFVWYIEQYVYPPFTVPVPNTLGTRGLLEGGVLFFFFFLFFELNLSYIVVLLHVL